MTQPTPGATAPRSPSRLFYGWYVAMGGAASNFLVIGIASFGFGVFISPMRQELGWSVAAISFGVSLRSFEQGLLAPVTGALLDRFGPRRMAIVGLTLLSLGLLLFSQSYTLLTFYASSMVIAVGQSVGSNTPFSQMVMHWFRRKRGRAMGILNAGNGAGYLAVPIIAVLVSQVGWRPTLIICAATIFLVGLPFTVFLRDLPRDRGLLPDGDDGVDAEAVERAGRITGMGVGEALRTPAFYLLVLASASGGTLGAWIVHQVPHLENVGFSREGAALIAGVYGIVQVGLRLLLGWLGDIVGRRRLYQFAFLLQGLGLITFAYLTPDRLFLLPFYYIMFASGHAATAVFQGTIIGDYFGTRRFATLRGFASIIQLPVGVVAPVLAGWRFDQTHTYTPIFTIYGVLTLTGALWIGLIRRPVWEREDADEIRAPTRGSAGS